MKTLIVGDVHAKVSNLNEITKLIDFVDSLLGKYKIDHLIFLGDLFHTHAIKRLEVEDFWFESFKQLESKVKNPIIVIEGNHDKHGSKELEAKLSSLKIFKELGIYVINKPLIYENIAFLPYMSDKDELIKASKQLYDQGATKLLMTHNTFSGAKYETGFYAPEAVEPDLICQDEIISGHIHTKQQIGKCFYAGSTIWDKTSDANVQKGIWLCDHNSDSSVKDKTFFSVENIVTPIYKIVLKEGDPEPELNDKATNYIELVGTQAWIKKNKKKYKGKARIKSVSTDRKRIVLRSDNNNNISLLDFLDKEFCTTNGVSKDDVRAYLQGLRSTHE